MKHILFARENTAWKTCKDDKKTSKFAGKGNPRNITSGKTTEYSKSWRLDDTNWVREIDFSTTHPPCGSKKVILCLSKNSKKMAGILFRTFAQGWFISVPPRA